MKKKTPMIRPISDAAKLPSNVDDFMAGNKMKRKKTLNDEVDRLVRKLYGDPAFRRYLDAIYDHQSIEGSIYIDDIEAARMIRDAGVAEENALVAGEKLKELRRSLNTVMRRYGTSRAERLEADKEAKQATARHPDAEFGNPSFDSTYTLKGEE